MQMHPQQMQLHHGPPGQQGIPQGPPPTMAQTRQEFVRQSEAVWLQLGTCPALPLPPRPSRPAPF